PAPGRAAGAGRGHRPAPVRRAARRARGAPRGLLARLARGGPRGGPRLIHADGFPGTSPGCPPEGRAWPADEGRAASERGPGAREAAVSREPGPLRRLLRLLGPGLIAGASDDDPATVGTCASVGASVGYTALWTVLFTTLLMMAVQYISARVGLASGRGLA